jgi:hypothetical protein
MNRDEHQGEMDGLDDRTPSNGGGPVASSASDPARPARGRRRRSRRRSVLGAAKWLFVAAFLLVGTLFAVIQTGLGDDVLANRVRAVLGNTLGPDLTIALDEASIRIGRDGRLAIEADAVRFLRRDATGDFGVLTAASSVRLLLDPVPALFGELRVSSVNVEGVTLDASLIDRGGRTNWDVVRVDALDALGEAAFDGLDRVFRMLTRSRTQSIRLIGSTVTGLGPTDDAEPATVRLDLLELALDETGTLTIDGTAAFGEQAIELHGYTERRAGDAGIDAVHLAVDGLERVGNRDFFATRGAEPGDLKGFGVDTLTTVTLSARRASESGTPTIEANIDLAPGEITLGGAVSELDASWLHLAYFPERRTIEILPSALNVGASTLPFTGGVIDLSNLAAVAGEGFALEMIVDDARASPSDSSEPSLTYGAKTFARFLKHEQRMVFDEITVASGLGAFFASAAVGFGDSSPEISFAGSVARMETAGIKQLWPHWIAKRPRQWVLDNVFGGTVSNGSVKAFIPAGRMAQRPGRLDLDENQLQIAFDIERARVGVAGDIPPLRDARGSLDLRGSRLDVAIDSATAYFGSGRAVSVADGTFSIAQTNRQPLMADLAMAVSGKADAVAELISYRPIDALDRIGFAAEEFSGDITGEVSARFGLIQSQQPPPPDWAASMQLAGVSVSRPVEGRQLAAITGSLDVDPDGARLDAAAEVDGVPLDLDIVQPIRAGGAVTPQRIVSGTLDDAQRSRFVPGLDSFVSGPVTLTLTRTGEGLQDAEIDLGNARLSVPGLNWSKAPGIGARATLTAAMEESGISIRDFVLSGDGFDVNGSMEIADSQLVSARFGRVRLSANDEYSVSVSRNGTGYDLDVRGRSADLRSVISGVRANAGAMAASGGGGQGVPIALRADLERAQGFNGEVLRSFQARYEGRGGAVSRVDARGVTAGGEAVVVALSPAEGGTDIAVNSGDAGAFARFADIYGRINGGFLDLKLQKRGQGPYAGTLIMRNFSVVDERQLQQLVSARAAGSNRSLNDLTRGQIDTSAAQFERAFARLQLGD